jgi:hypothetical protein
MKRKRPVLWYDEKGAPRSEPFKITLSQLGRDLIEVDQQETGASEAEIREANNLRDALATKDDRSAFVVAWRIKHNDYVPLLYVLSKRADKAHFLRKVVDALDTIDGKLKPYFERPKANARKIVTAYYAAVDHLHDIHFGKGEGLVEPGEEDPTIPRLAEVKDQFVALFPNDKLPADWTIRKTLDRLSHLLRHELGRRKGSSNIETRS